MELIYEIFRDQGLDLEGRTLERESAKGIILRGHKLLLVYSSFGGGYKFPGGGVRPGETDEETLAREIQEECGARLDQILGEFGMVIEYKRPFETEYEVFKMISRYYICRVDNGSGQLCLDDYEQELGYQPRWVDIKDAVQANRRLSNSAGANVPDWIAREAYVLELLKQHLENSGFIFPPVLAPPASDPPWT
jgi:8-oxo-dGTP pyrophosphatase MutT (NUDIX family)